MRLHVHPDIIYPPGQKGQVGGEETWKGFLPAFFEQNEAAFAFTGTECVLPFLL